MYIAYYIDSLLINLFFLLLIFTIPLFFSWLDVLSFNRAISLVLFIFVHNSFCIIDVSTMSGSDQSSSNSPYYMTRRRVGDFLESQDHNGIIGGGSGASGGGEKRMMNNKLTELLKRRMGRKGTFGVLLLMAFLTMLAKFPLLHTLQNMESGYGFIMAGSQRLEINLTNETSTTGSVEKLLKTPQKFLISNIWEKPNGENLYKCINRSKNDESKHFTLEEYMISDMVAIAKLMNATLVLPSLDHSSYWTDPSGFKDIFDVGHFVEVLKDDIEIVESVPRELDGVTPLEKPPVSWSKPAYYRNHMASLLRKHKVIRFTHSDSRLANNGLSASIQRLRCRSMYEALKFREGIADLGRKLVDRIRGKQQQRFIALHLR
ncbi:unnamed protein product [Linum tenue]|uniref:O-fucosyltransferase family protein n=1 Tax=Linum tenue TaxID=586396 RepID=A0AAV0JQA0_9ROSI|nr:unnamed protein product [Linum tenue]